MTNTIQWHRIGPVEGTDTEGCSPHYLASKAIEALRGSGKYEVFDYGMLMGHSFIESSDVRISITKNSPHASFDGSMCVSAPNGNEHARVRSEVATIIKSKSLRLDEGFS